MSGTGKVNLFEGKEKYDVTATKADSLAFAPYFSDNINVATTAANKAFDIPAGAYVSMVGVIGVTAVSAADIDVGFAADANYFIDGLTSIATPGDMVLAPLPVATPSQSLAVAPPCGARYFATATPITVTINSTCPGSIKIVADIKFPS